MSNDCLGTSFPVGLQVLTLLHEFIQSTLDALKGGQGVVPEVVYDYVLDCNSRKILRLRILSTSLCVPARGMVCMEWAKAYFLHPEKYPEASEDHCIAYCRTVGEP